MLRAAQALIFWPYTTLTRMSFHNRSVAMQWVEILPLNPVESAISRSTRSRTPTMLCTIRSNGCPKATRRPSAPPCSMALLPGDTGSPSHGLTTAPTRTLSGVLIGHRDSVLTRPDHGNRLDGD